MDIPPPVKGNRGQFDRASLLTKLESLGFLAHPSAARSNIKVVMAKVVIEAIGRKGRSSISVRGVVERRVRGETGKVRIVRRIDCKSRTLSSDLTYVFTRNVAAARRENKRATGVLDFVPDRSQRSESRD